MSVGVVIDYRAMTAPTSAVLAVGVVVTAALADRFPHLVMAVGAFAGLASGPFSLLNRAGEVALVLGGIISLFKLLSTTRLDWLKYIALPALVISWLGLRLSMGSGLAASRPLVVCLAAAVLALFSWLEAEPWEAAITWAGGGFVVISYWFGTLDPTTLRFEGISGNPNRMVMGVLVTIPLLLGVVLGTRRSHWARVLAFVPLVIALRLILSSGSDQGAAGLVVIAFAFVIWLARRIDGTGAWLLIGGVAVALVAVVVEAHVVPTLTPDLLTLSGRTALYRAGIEEFLAHPLVGSGVIHVSEGLSADRSAHNSIIGILASSGIFAGLAWLSFLILAIRGATSRLRCGYLAGGAALGVVVSQLVQSVEQLSLTWIVLTLATLEVLVTRSEKCE